MSTVYSPFVRLSLGTVLADRYPPRFVFSPFTNCDRKSAILRNGCIAAIPLRSTVEIGGVQVGPHGHRTGHGLAACGIPGGVDTAGIHSKMADKVFRQLNGLPGGFFTPVSELCRNHGHLGVQPCPCGKATPIQIAAGRIFTEPHHVIARHNDHHRKLAAAIVTVWQIIAVMDVTVRAGEDLLCKQASLNRLRCDSRCCAFQRFFRQFGTRFRRYLRLGRHCCTGSAPRESQYQHKSHRKRKKSIHFCSSTGGTISAYFLSISGVLV